mmetsp:Transcript_4251/g.11224  ORF Transcript_4251/g.11224 Transcript_4251/m.11224 type:complete len:233 (-) Transcript_4251:157-855(-)
MHRQEWVLGHRRARQEVAQRARRQDRPDRKPERGPHRHARAGRRLRGLDLRAQLGPGPQAARLPHRHVGPGAARARGAAAADQVRLRPGRPQRRAPRRRHLERVREAHCQVGGHDAARARVVRHDARGGGAGGRVPHAAPGRRGLLLVLVDALGQPAPQPRAAARLRAALQGTRRRRLGAAAAPLLRHAQGVRAQRRPLPHGPRPQARVTWAFPQARVTWAFRVGGPHTLIR